MNHKYMKNLPENFFEHADINIIFSNIKFPVHSQFLRLQSKLMENLLTDVGKNIDMPCDLSIDNLKNITIENLELFLSQVYNFSNDPINNEFQARDLFIVADLFESTKIMKRCIEYFKQKNKSFLKIENVIEYLQISEKFNIDDFYDDCIRFVADNFVLLEKYLTDVTKETCIRIVEKINYINIIVSCQNNIDNAIYWLLIAEKYNLTQVIDKSCDFIAINYDILQNSPSLQKITTGSYHKIAKKIQQLFNIRKQSIIFYKDGWNGSCESCDNTMKYYCKKNTCPGHYFFAMYYKKVSFNDIRWDNLHINDCYGNKIILNYPIDYNVH